MTSADRWAIGIGTALGVALGAGLLVWTFHDGLAAPAPTGLQPGHRYQATFTCPAAIAQPTLPAGAQVVSASPSRGTAAAAGTWVLVFDYTGPAVPAQLSQAGCSVDLADLGATPAPPAMVTFTQGHRYLVSLSCVVPIPPPTPAFLGVGPVVIVAVAPSPAPSLSPSWQVTLDFTGPSIQVPSLAGSASACALTVKDLGPTPITGGAPQAVAVPWGGNALAKPIAGSTLAISAQGPLSFVSGPADSVAVQASALGPGSNQARVTLTGRPGVIALRGLPPSPHAAAPAAWVTVS